MELFVKVQTFNDELLRETQSELEGKKWLSRWLLRHHHASSQQHRYHHMTLRLFLGNLLFGMRLFTVTIQNGCQET